MVTDLRRGSALAGYRIEATLGRGGMGAVYLAHDLRLKRPVAVKLIAPDLASEVRFRERFLRETELAASLDHSHVVPVYEAGEDTGQLYLAMRYVEGDDLGSLLEREGPLEPARAVELCAQVAEALDAAHERGLVHRDVKPGNVLVTEEGGREHCYLTDFGLSRAAADTLSADGHHLSGSVDYTPPEQIAHQPTDARADLYSLGCVLCQCLTGQPPFQRPRPMATLFAHVNDDPPPVTEQRPELPAEIDHVLAKALAKDPDERYASCRELTEAARDALGLESERRLSRRRLLALIAAVAIVVAAAAIPAIILTGGDTGPKVALPLTDNTLLRLDPTTGEPTAALPLGSDPALVEAGEGAVWVVDKRDEMLLEIDPSGQDVRQTIELDLRGNLEDFRVGAGGVWMWWWKYDLGSKSWSEPGRSQSWLVDVHGEDVWYGRVRPIEADALVRLNAKTGRLLETVPMPHSLNTNAPTVGDDAIWLWPYFDAVEPTTLLVERLDPETGEIVASIDTGLRGIDTMAVGEEGVWALGDSLVEIDPATNTVVQRIRVGRSPDLIALGEGYVWVGNRRDQTLTRVDPATADLLTIDVGGRLQAFAVGEGGAWVIVRPA